jgi:aldose 1-epimerase
VKDTISGFFVTITDLGANTLRIVIPDRNGIPGDVALTQETPELLINFGAMLGATVGRVANRVAKGKFSLEGKDYTLFVNNGPNSLHGGKVGFDKKIWKLDSKNEDSNEVSLKFVYVSPDMEEGYPGTLTNSIKYIIQPNKIAWEFEATTDKTTILNLTNHNYYNLDGPGVRIDDQEISIRASTYNLVDGDGLTIGEAQPVLPSIDTRQHKKFSEIFEKFGDVDNNFFLDDAKDWSKNQIQMHQCAVVYSPKTGRLMTIKTSEPSVQLYTANSLGDGPIKTTNGNIKADKHFAFCLETQRRPDAINHPIFKDYVILKPGENYYHKTEHEFKLT